MCEQMGKLLVDGCMDLLLNFKLLCIGCNFKVFFVKQLDGKIGFEFEKKELKVVVVKKMVKLVMKDVEIVMEGVEEKLVLVCKIVVCKIMVCKMGL